MENGAIADYQITASSQLDKYHAASRARLNIKLSGNMKGGWTARTEDLKQWLQVDLGSYTIVTRVATQGRNGYNQWVTKYRLLYAGNDGMNFHSYKELGDTSAKVSLLSINPSSQFGLVSFRGTFVSANTGVRPNISDTFLTVNDTFSRRIRTELHFLCYERLSAKVKSSFSSQLNPNIPGDLGLPNRYSPEMNRWVPLEYPKLRRSHLSIEA